MKNRDVCTVVMVGRWRCDDARDHSHLPWHPRCWNEDDDNRRGGEKRGAKIRFRGARVRTCNLARAQH